MPQPKFTIADLPIGTKLISLGDPGVIGTITQHGITREMDDVTIVWTNGNTSFSFVHQIINEKYKQ